MEIPITSSRKLLLEATGRNDGFCFIPNFNSTLNSLKNLQSKPKNEADQFLDHFIKKYKKELKHEVGRIKKKKKSNNFFGRDHTDLETSLKTNLEQLGINIKQRIIDQPGTIPGIFGRKDGYLFMEYNGLESLTHETEHYLQLQENDGIFFSQKCVAYEIQELYAKLASLKAIAKYGSGIKMWPTYTNWKAVPNEEALDDFIGGLFEEINYKYTDSYPIIKVNEILNSIK